MQKWEYAALSVFASGTPRWSDSRGKGGERDTLLPRLNELGEEGWELAGVVPGSPADNALHALLFKRPKP